MARRLIAAMSRPSSQATPLGASVEKDLRELLLVVFHGRVIISDASDASFGLRGTHETRRDRVRASSASLVSMAKVFYNLILIIPMQGSQEFLHAGVVSMENSGNVVTECWTQELIATLI